MAARRLRLQKADADLVQKLDETMQEMRAQVREHFDTLASPASGSARNTQYPDCALTGTTPHGPRNYYDMRYAIRYGSRECEIQCEYVMAARMRYEYAMAARMRCAICDYAVSRVNAMRTRYGPRECDMRYANRLSARYAIRE